MLRNLDVPLHRRAPLPVASSRPSLEVGAACACAQGKAWTPAGPLSQPGRRSVAGRPSPPGLQRSRSALSLPAAVALAQFGQLALLLGEPPGQDCLGEAIDERRDLRCRAVAPGAGQRVARRCDCGRAVASAGVRCDQGLGRVGRGSARVCVPARSSRRAAPRLRPSSGAG
jgi:hypothetical protein